MPAPELDFQISLRPPSRHSIRLLTISLAIAVHALISRPAFCEDNLGDNIGDFRLDLIGGAFIPNDLKWSGTGAISGLPFAGSGKISAHTGSVVGAVLAHQLNPYLSLEITGAYLSTTFNDLSGTVSIAGTSASGSFPTAARFDAVGGFLNLNIAPFGARGVQLGPDLAITPFVGAGPGAMHSTTEINSFNFGPATIPVDVKSGSTALAANVLFGTDVRVLPRLDVGVGYDFVWIDARHLGSSSQIQTSNAAVSAHVISGVLEYHF